jgi:hypothetical protein
VRNVYGLDRRSTSLSSSGPFEICLLFHRRTVILHYAKINKLSGAHSFIYTLFHTSFLAK